VSVPVVVGCGEQDEGPGPAQAAPGVAAALPWGELRSYPHLGHFGPLQDPDTIAGDAAAFFTEA
jgi:pimeloyl-ACP methyl ester carboxylesterase